MQEVTFNPNNKQYEAWEYLTDSTHTEIGYGGGASGGKSYLGCVWIVTMCLANPNTGWLIGRRELTNLKKTTLLTLFKVFKDFNIQETGYNYTQQNNIITFENGSQIFLMDLDYKPSDPLYTRLGGLELTGGFIDESNECPEEAINVLKTRLGRRGDLKPKLLETFNPSKNHVYKRFYKPSVDNQMPQHRVFIKALATDNPHTTEAYLEQLRTADTITRERLLYGNFEYDDDPSALIRFDAISDLFTNTITQSNTKYLTADIARYGHDKTVVMVWKGLEVYKILYWQEEALDTTAKRIKDVLTEEQIPFSQAIIDEDGVGGGVLDLLRGVKGFIANSRPFEISKPSFTEKILPNFSNLKSQAYFKLAEYINNHKIRVTSDDGYVKNCLIEELEQIKRKDPDSDKKLAIIPKERMKESLGRSPDFADALMMRMFFELNFTNAPSVSIKIQQYQNRERLLKNWAE